MAPAEVLVIRADSEVERKADRACAFSKSLEKNQVTFFTLDYFHSNLLKEDLKIIKKLLQEIENG